MNITQLYTEVRLKAFCGNERLSLKGRARKMSRVQLHIFRGTGERHMHVITKTDQERRKLHKIETETRSAINVHITFTYQGKIE